MPVTVTVTAKLDDDIDNSVKINKAHFYDKVNGVTNEDRSIKCGGNGYDRKDHGSV